MSEPVTVVRTTPAWVTNFSVGKVCFLIAMVLALLASFGVHFGPAALFPLALAFLSAGFLLG